MRRAYVRVTCVHRQSLTFHDLRVEHRPYCTLCIPIPVALLRGGGFSFLYTDALYVRARVCVCAVHLSVPPHDMYQAMSV